MRRKKPCFLVLESYWSENLAERESVLPFVKGLCDLNRWEFHYRTFDSTNDLRLWIKNFDRIRRSRAEKIVYVATHGSRAGRLWTLEGTIPMVTLARILRPARSIAGLHLGSCNLGQPAILDGLVAKTNLQWVAAYDQEVPWIESTTLDLLFWSWIYSGAPRTVRSRRLTPEGAAHELYEHFNYARKMGFRVVRRDEPSGKPVSSWDSWKGPGGA
ncbi:MAG: hypothetical protein ABIK65_10700 [Candidatus Eisenbacteria bacterium]